MNKRFTVPDKYSLSHSKVQLNGEPLTNAEIVRLLNVNDEAFVENFALKKENNYLKQQFNDKHFLNLIDDYYIEYEGDIFSMHKPSDIRSLIYLMNRKQGYTELQCEYNDEELKE